jgi:SOS response regulatory protein OraA/RecX
MGLGNAHRENIRVVMARLKERGLLDDAAFAEFWKENRQEFSPRSQRLTGLERTKLEEEAVIASGLLRTAQALTTSLEPQAILERLNDELFDPLIDRVFKIGSLHICCGFAHP